MLLMSRVQESNPKGTRYFGHEGTPRKHVGLGVSCNYPGQFQGHHEDAYTCVILNCESPCTVRPSSITAVYYRQSVCASTIKSTTHILLPPAAHNV